MKLLLENWRRLLEADVLQFPAERRVETEAQGVMDRIEAIWVDLGAEGRRMTQEEADMMDEIKEMVKMVLMPKGQ